MNNTNHFYWICKLPAYDLVSQKAVLCKIKEKKLRERSFWCSNDNWHLNADIVMFLVLYRYSKSLSLQAELAPLYSLLRSGNLLYITQWDARTSSRNTVRHHTTLICFKGNIIFWWLCCWLLVTPLWDSFHGWIRGPTQHVTLFDVH